MSPAILKGSREHDPHYDDGHDGPSPAEQVRLQLIEHLHAGRPFNAAWKLSLAATEMPPAGPDAFAWLAAFRETREVWQLAYEGADLPRTVAACAQLPSALP